MIYEELSLSEEEIYKRTKRLIPFMHPYGYFALEVPKMRTDAKEATEGYEHARLFGEQRDAYMKDSKVLEHLFKEGFIKYRFDVIQDDKKFVELTDRGRLLKSAGSLEWFYFKEKYFPSDKTKEFIRTIVGVLLGALLGYYLQKEPITNVTVGSPKV